MLDRRLSAALLLAFSWLGSAPAEARPRASAGSETPTPILEAEADVTPPAVTVVAPTTYFILRNARPEIAFTFTDPSGIDLSRFRFLIDEVDHTASCVLEPTAARCLPVGDLAAGPHVAAMRIADTVGNLASTNVAFDLLLTAGPHLRELTAAADSALDPDRIDHSDGVSAFVELRNGGRGLVRFDLEALRSLGERTRFELDAALIRLDVDQIRNLESGGRTLSALRVTAPWVESEATWECPADETPGGKTNCGVSWEGGRFAYKPDAAVTVLNGATGNYDWLVTPTVRRFVAPAPDTVANHGWLFDLGVGTSRDPRVRFSARERGETFAPRLRVTFRVPYLADVTPPELAFTAPGPLVINDTTPDFALTFADAESGVAPASFQLTLDGGTVLASCTLSPGGAVCTVPELTAGPHLAEARVADRGGLVTTRTLAFTVVLDALAPTLTILAPSGTVLGDPSPDVLLEYGDAGIGVDPATLVVTLDGLPLTCTAAAAGATCTTPDLAAGPHTISARLDDLAGNRATTTGGFQLVLDAEAPTVTVEQPADPLPPGQFSPAVVVTYADASELVLGSLGVQVDALDITASCTAGPTGATCSTPTLTPGLHTAHAQIADLHGNVGSASRSFTVVDLPDETPPLLTVVGPTGRVINDPTPDVVLAFSDERSGIALATLEVTVNGADVSSLCAATATGAVCMPPLAAALYTVSAAIADEAGNRTTAEGEFELVLDERAPEVTFLTPFLTPTTPAILANRSPQVTLQFADADSRIDPASFVLLVDGLPATAPCTVDAQGASCPTSLAEGAHTLAAQVADIAGNLGLATTGFVLDLDLVAPTISLLAPTGTVLANQPAGSLRLGFGDDDSGVAPGSLSVQLDGLEIADGCRISNAAEALCDFEAVAGLHAVLATVRDRAGNLGAASGEFSLVVDGEAPTVTIVSPAEPLVLGAVPPALEATVTDLGTGVAPEAIGVTVDGTLVPGCEVIGDTVRCVAGLSEGTHVLVVRATDRAGNRATATRSFQYSAGDRVAPSLNLVSPVVSPVVGDATPAVVLAFSDAGSGIDLSSLRVSLDATDLTPGCVVTASGATCEPPALTAGLHTVAAAIRDLDGNQEAVSLTFELQLSLAVTITTPDEGFLTRGQTVTLTGSVDPLAESLEVHGIAASLAGDGTFTVADVPLVEGSNTLTAIARNAAGGIGGDTVSVVRDTLGPQVVFRTPPDAFVTTSQQIMLTGETNDPGSSNAAAVPISVTVNGVAAGSENDAFVVPSFLLQPGENELVATAVDAAGNLGRATIRVTYLAGADRKIEEILGNGQTASAGEVLAQPLVVRLTDFIGNPLGGRTVRFVVSRGDGKLRSTGQEGAEVTAISDDFGFAQALFAVGQRAGEGNHEVSVTSPGFPGTVIFCASAAPRTPVRIVRIVGNNQTGAQSSVVGSAMPKPLLVQVFDELGNPVAGVPVTFSVLTGGGTLRGSPSAIETTDSEGKAAIELTLGLDVGVEAHTVQATFAGNTQPVALFAITGLSTGAEADTRISGLVLDNQDAPVPGVTVSVDGTTLQAVTDARGRFAIPAAPVGTVHLRVDGGTATVPGSWPVLGFELTTVSGQDNTVGMAIRLLPIDVAGGQWVGGDQDVTIPIDGIPGGSLTVFAHSALFPDGAREGTVSITQVHADKVPMIAPQGSNFMLAWTIQPPNVRFNPPARIQIPNMGSPPGAVVEIFSFDHDLGEFVTAGTAEVSLDGQSVVSRPGFGVAKTGWGGCVPPPPPPTDACNDSACTVCVGGSPQPRCGECENCDGGNCEPQTVDSVTAHANGEEEQAVVGKDKDVHFDADVEANCSVRYQWDFGDGETSEDAAPSHRYEEVGTYQVSVEVTCDGCAAGGSQSDTVEVKVIEVDLVLDELAEEDEPAPNEEDPGAYLVVNNDDDNENDTEDLEDSGTVSNETELVEMKLMIDDGITQGKLRLEAGAGGDKVKVWEQETKGTEVQLPKTWDFEAGETPPESVWVEGAASSGAESDVELKLVYENGDQEPIEDTAKATVIKLEFKVLPDEDVYISADEPLDPIVAVVLWQSFEDPEEFEPVEDGAQVEFRVIEGSGSLGGSATTEMSFATSELSLSPSPGTTARVEGKLTRVRVDLPGLTEDLEIDFKKKSGTYEVIAGLPASVSVSGGGTYPSDTLATVSLSASVADRNGNVVEDDTAIFWEVDESSTPFVGADTSTAGGQAAATLRAPNENHDQVVRVSASGATASTTVSVTPVAATLSGGPSQIDFDANGTASLTLSTDASAGSGVFWLTSNGTITGSPVVGGGGATAILSSQNAIPGPVVVVAAVASRLVIWEGEFVSDGNAVRLEHRYLVAGAPPSGTMPVTRADGSVVQVPVFGATPVVVTGTPGTIATVGFSGNVPGDAFTFESAPGGVVPGAFGALDLTLEGATLDGTTAHGGAFSALFSAGDRAVIAQAPVLDFRDGFRIGLWLRPSALGAATLVAKDAAWGLELLADGSLRGRAATSAGNPVVLSAPGALTAGQWSYVEFQFTGSALQLSVDGTTTSEPATGELDVNTMDVVVAEGFTGHLDDLRLDGRAGSAGGLLIEGLDAAGQTVIGADGTATFTLRAAGELPPGTDTTTQSFAVFFSSSDQRGKTLDGLPLGTEMTAFALGMASGASGQAQVQTTKAGVWATIGDVILSFLGGDPTTTAGTIANVVGGVLIVGDIGAVVKNLWRMAFYPDEVNWPELALTALGLLTEFAPVAGEVLDVPISVARSIIARIGDTPLARIWLRRFKDIVKNGRSLSAAEDATFRAMRDDPTIGNRIVRFIKSDESWDSFARLRTALCAGRHAGVVEAPEGEEHAATGLESEPLAMSCLLLENFLTTVATRYGDDIAQKVTLAAGKIGEEAFQRIAAQGDQVFEEAMDGLAKAVRSVSVEDASRVVKNSFLYTANYAEHHLLRDFGKIGDAPGFDRMVKAMKQNQGQARGAVYELQAAAHLKNQGQAVSYVGKPLPLGAGRRDSDIDVLAGGVLYQVKNSYAALSNGGKGVEKAEEWIGAALRQTGGDASRVKYIVPPGVTIPTDVQKVLDRYSVTIVRVAHP